MNSPATPFSYGTGPASINVTCTSAARIDAERNLLATLRAFCSAMADTCFGANHDEVVAYIDDIIKTLPDDAPDYWTTRLTAYLFEYAECLPDPRAEAVLLAAAADHVMWAHPDLGIVIDLVCTALPDEHTVGAEAGLVHDLVARGREAFPKRFIGLRLLVLGSPAAVIWYPADGGGGVFLGSQVHRTSLIDIRRQEPRRRGLWVAS